MSGGALSAGYSIAALSKLSGVSCHVLRVWERRYGYPKPDRSAANQRRYSADQVQAIKSIAGLVRSGRPVGEVIAAFIAAGTVPASAPIAAGPHPPSASNELVDALCAGDLGGADDLLTRVAAELSPMDLVVRVLEPALTEVGERWFNRTAEVFQEHFATGVLLRALGGALDRARRANPNPRHRALVATMQGERHEGGVLILATALELSGWRAITLGVDVPVGELARAAAAWKPDAIGISFVLSRNINKRFGELATLRGLPVFVGGRSLMNYTGLARRYGLIPLPGSLPSCLVHWDAEFLEWAPGRGA